MKSDNKNNFLPPWYLRNSMVQTLLNSSSLRNRGHHLMEEKAKEIILDAGGDVHLQGFLSLNEKNTSKGLVILIHGWEGSAASAYIINNGRFLYDAGFDIFRLNLRDHGESHHLNRGLFLGTLIDESFEAVKNISSRFRDRPVFLSGFSMGANFTLRMAHLNRGTVIENLKHVVCINPPLDPMTATCNIDRYPLIKGYFLKKWKKSLRIKQEIYPDIYNLEAILEKESCMAMTEVLVREHSDYRDTEDYFSRYTLKDGYLEKITMPVTIITSKDDPIIAIEDFYETKHKDNINLIIPEYGGHCGYIDGLELNSWYQDIILDIFNSK